MDTEWLALSRLATLPQVSQDSQDRGQREQECLPLGEDKASMVPQSGLFTWSGIASYSLQPRHPKIP